MSFCPRLLICEGYEDKHFFKYLIAARNLPTFRVEDTSNPPHDRQGGISKIRRAINGIRVEHPSRFRQLSDILVVADNDEDPDGNFGRVREQIEAALGHAPGQPLQRTEARPRVTILMLPWTGEHGNLEALCCEAARSVDQTTGSHVDHFLALVHADQWLDTRKGKAWLRANLAARADDPFVTLGNVSVSAAPDSCDGRFFQPRGRRFGGPSVARRGGTIFNPLVSGFLGLEGFGVENGLGQPPHLRQP